MPANREYELKFSIDPADAETLVSHPLVRPALRDRRVQQLETTYFDTPDGLLRRRRFSLRVRKAPSGAWHTLKRSSGSVVDRGEWEQRSDSPRPDPVWLRETPAAPLMRQPDVAIEPLFTVDVTRTTMPLRYRRTRVELALDHGHVRSESLSLPLDELELELKGGEEKHLHALARRLARDLPITLSLVTKSERGYGLRDLTWGRPDSKVRPGLRRRATNAQAFEAIIQSSLAQVLRNIALIGGEVDVEAVHQARVSLRRLRAACKLFEPVLRRKRWARLKPDLKWLSAKLGAARDADVFQTETFDPAARAATVEGAAELAALMQVRRLEAHRALRKALLSARTRMLFIDTLIFSTDGVRRLARDERFRPFVRKALARRRRVLARDVVRLADLTPNRRHDVRKDAKTLRYSLDFVKGAPGLTGAGGKKVAKHLKALQSGLGAMQDQVALRAYLGAAVLGGRPRQVVSPALARARTAAAALAEAPVADASILRDAKRLARRLAP